MAKYEPAAIELKWQKRWKEDKLYRTPDAKRGAKGNTMVLVEFPYPSGNLHMGHWYAFALPDMYARYQRMNGYNVMYPIGFDAFGLPAENAAITRGLHPEQWTRDNIAFMTTQLESMGAMFDWSREVRTIDPAYYHWTQWMFLRMFDKDLAYRAKTTVNWCPTDKTVLANEQVVDGCCERCSTPVQQRELEQWMMRITKYADRLVDDIEGLDWPHTARVAQQNWISRSTGARIQWSVASGQLPVLETGNWKLETFTTRPDTTFGVTFLVVSPELAQQWMSKGWNAPHGVREYVKRALGKRELERQETREKTGVDTGIRAMHPFTGKDVPVWIADYVLGSYGTGAIMAVPAHDERDFAFAKKFDLPIRQVIESPNGSTALPYIGSGTVINSIAWADGLLSEDASEKVMEELERQKCGGPQTTFKLRDWVLSRQRYWGVPIPIIHCPVCGYVPVPDKDLPVNLPPLEDFKPADDGRSPLAKAAEWLKVKCPKCKGPAERETDTMDTFVDSSWYYLRYTDPKNTKQFASPAKMKKWLPVPIYIGGAEHNTMHLLYSRFIAKVLADLGYVDFPKGEPFTARRNHGIILGPDGQKMSKSRGNVVDPDKEVAQYGADTVRMFLAFAAPYEQGGPWDPKGITGVWRFLNRVWNLVTTKEFVVRTANVAAAKAVNAAIKNIGDDLEHLRFNTAVSELMKALNVLEQDVEVGRSTIEEFLLILAPLAPHIAEELWRDVLGHKKSIHLERWPEHDPKLLMESVVQVPVQVNGKVRGVITIAPNTAEQDVVFAAKQDANVAKYLEDKEPVRTVYIPGKLLNLVVKE